jgi:ABC-2 type transport system ATP-binding protein
MYAIETNSLTKFYGKSRGIIDLNLRVKEGEIFGFIGPNGAGKSTAIRLFLSLLFPSKGSGKIFEYDIVRQSTKIKQIVGFVPSEVHYYDNMKVGELLKYSSRFYKVSLNSYFHSLIETLDLDLNRKISDLSMGNRKKLAVIQSLIHKPKLLILDEPTSGLDPLMQNHFFDIIREANENGATIFFSSHILSEVEKFCHRVAIIKEGRIVSEDDISSIKEKAVSRVSLILKDNKLKINLKTPGIISSEKINNGNSFLFQGCITDLLKELSELPIEKINITEPSLEEIFIHFYRDENMEGKK